MNGMGTILYIVCLVGVFYLLLIRPQQKQAQKRNQMLGQLKQGDKVVTIGGICGVVKAVTEKKVFLEIADGLTIEMLRTAISQTVVDDDDEDEEDEYEDDEYEYDEYDDEFEEEDKEK